MKNLLTALGNYFAVNSTQRILLVDRAFLGLFAIFSVLRKDAGKSKVLFTSNTCASPVYACIYAGLTPIFTDISLEDFLMDTDETLKIIHECKDELAAVVYIYTFGHTSHAIFSIKSVTQMYGIILIEDVAQAFGSKVDGFNAGTVSDISVFSFGYSKHIDAGSGGFILINNQYSFEREEINSIIKNCPLFEENDTLLSDYSKQFYELRSKALQIPDKLIQYNDFHIKYKALYFKRLNPNWCSIEEKLKQFLSCHQHSLRNGIAKQYYESLINEEFLPHIYAPLVKDEYSVYRYTILVNNYCISLKLSNHLRSNHINCSNLYLPVSRFFYNNNFERAIDFSRRVINLWVDINANNEYVVRTLQLINDFFKNNINEKHQEDKAFRNDPAGW